MNVLINFAPLKSGGGQNVALNFLLGIERVPHPDLELHFLVASGSELQRFLQSRNIPSIATPRHPILRILWELVPGRRWLRRLDIHLTYSYFGYAFFPRRVRQVSGSADSNIYYPEVDFWLGYSRLQRIGRTLVDRYRLFGVRRSYAVVFENPDIERRAKELYGLQRTRCIPPSIAAIPPRTDTGPLFAYQTDYPKAVMLSGWHRNKNVQMLPRLAAEMRDRGKPVEFVLTARSDAGDISREFSDLVDELDVSNLVTLIGSVGKERLASLYTSTSIVLLLSRLESFSNTIIESWYYKRPLIVADESWSRALCGDAAYYANRDSTQAIGDGISRILSNDEYRGDLLRRGQSKLQHFPPIEERVAREFDFLREVIEDV